MALKRKTIKASFENVLDEKGKPFVFELRPVTGLKSMELEVMGIKVKEISEKIEKGEEVNKEELSGFIKALAKVIVDNSNATMEDLFDEDGEDSGLSIYEMMECVDKIGNKSSLKVQ